MKTLIALFLLVASSHASAAIISMNVSGAGDALNTPLTLSAILDVDEGSGETLAFSSFDIDVLFDSRLFSLVDGSVGSSLPTGVVSDVNSVGAGAGVTYFNFNFSDVMITSDTTLFSLQLNALSAGTSSVALMVNSMFSGGFKTPTGFMTPPMPVLLAQNSVSESLSVAQSVPVPHTLGLFALALGLLVHRCRR